MYGNANNLRPMNCVRVGMGDLLDLRRMHRPEVLGPRLVNAQLFPAIWPVILTIVLGLCLDSHAGAQVGPNSPAAAANVAGPGANLWSNTSNIFTSNNAYANVGAKGLSTFLVGTDFQFNLTGAVNILGIQLDVEKSTFGSSDVALLNGWSTGLSKTISAGINRCLVVVYSEENGTTSQDITALTYGGRPMTVATDFVVGGGAAFSGRLKVWTLLESEIALASGTAIVPTYGPSTQIEFCESFSSAVFQHVDQLVPITDLKTTGAQASTNPQQLGTPLNTLAGSMAVNAVMCGNNTTPAIADGGTNTYTINSGYTEGTDIYYANVAVAPTSGVSFQTAYKAIASNGTEQPTCTFAGSVNRYLMVAFTLQRARELDNEVRLLKNGAIGGSNLASSAAWPTSDAVITYGGPTNLWGRAWSRSDINSAGFGAALTTFVQNGTARVDHYRITVYTEIQLPIELLDFRAAQVGEAVRLDWVTATEHNNDHWLVQRSRDGVDFEDVERVEGAINSNTTLFYSITDVHPWNGPNYYRLKQVDTDGSISFSPVVVVDVEHDHLVVFPNPTDGSITVFDVSLDQDEVAVYGSDMRLIRTHVGTGADPVIHLGDLPDGTYVLMVRSGQDIRTTRVVKESSRK